MKILFIDDEFPVLESLQKALKPMKYECILFKDPYLGLESYKNNHYDVVVTDIKMPKMNGNEILKIIKEYNSQAYVIIMTAYASSENAIDAINGGAYAFFRKPLDFRSFINILVNIEKEMQMNKDKEIIFSNFIEKFKNVQDDFEELKNVIDKIAILKNKPLGS